MGDGVVLTARPLAAQPSRRPVVVSAVTFAGFLPWPGAPVSGALVDRWARRVALGPPLGDPTATLVMVVVDGVGV